MTPRFTITCPLPAHIPTDFQEFKKIIGLTVIFLGGAFASAVLAAKTPFIEPSPRYFLTVLTLFGYAEVCLCKIYPKKTGGKK